MGVSQESLLIFCFHLYLRIEPSLWFSDSYYRISSLGLSERTHLSLWRLLKRLLFPTQTAEKRNGRRKTSMRFHRVEVATVTGSPPSGGEQHSPSDGCGWGVFIV